MSDQLSELFERVVKPISEESPCGENARHDDRYAESKSEIMKLTAGSAGIDWDAVARNTDALLSEKTKDLTLVAYLNLSLLKTSGYGGLGTGLRVLHRVIDDYWEPMFPPLKRMKARIQTFEWIDERLSVMVEAQEPGADEAAAVRECKAFVDELPDKVQAVAKERVTGFSRLRSAVTNWHEKLPPEKTEPKTQEPAAQAPVAEKQAEPSSPQATPEPPQPEAPQETATPSPEAPASPTPQPQAAPASMVLPPAVEEVASIDQGLLEITKIVHLIREVQPLSPVVYRLSRVARWEKETTGPMAAPDGTTKIPAPREQRFQILQAQLNSGNWASLTQTAEHMFISEPGCSFNMNLQRYVALGLENQGADEAAAAVRFEAGRLLLRLPEIADLTYASGLPFADGETKSWCDEVKQLAEGPGGSDVEAPEDAEWLEEATIVAQKKNIGQAIKLVSDAIKSAGNPRTMMKRQLDGAKLFSSHREFQWAVPILESLYAKIDAVHLRDWEPEFCSEAWELLLKGYDGMPKGAMVNESTHSQKNAILQRLYEISLEKAAALTPKKVKK